MIVTKTPMIENSNYDAWCRMHDACCMMYDIRVIMLFGAWCRLHDISSKTYDTWYMVYDILVMLYDLWYTVHDVSPSKDVSCCPRSIFDAIFVDFGREMEASWHPKRSKIEAAGSSLGALGGLPGRLGSVLDRLRGLLGSGGGPGLVAPWLEVALAA